jgi:hypothetical protein
MGLCAIGRRCQNEGEEYGDEHDILWCHVRIEKADFLGGWLIVGTSRFVHE